MKRKVQVAVLYCDQSKQNKLLMLKLIPERGSHWQNVTGHVEKNETPIEAAYRELFEETKISKDQIQMVDTKHSFQFTDRFGQQRQEHTYIAWSQTDQIEIDPIEHTEFKWVDLKDVKEQDFGFASHWELIQMVGKQS